MNQRRDQLLPAADALRIWLHSRRTLWSTVPIPTLPVMRSPLVQPEPARLTPVPAVAVPTVVQVERPAPMESPQSGGGVWLFLSASWPIFAVGALIIAGAIAFLWHKTDTKTAAPRTLATQPAAAEASPQTSRPTGEPAQNVPAAPAESVADGAGLMGRLVVETDPTGAQVVIDGHDSGVAPLTVDALASGAHTVVLRATVGSVQRTVSIASGETTELREAIFSGWLRVSSPIELQISEGTRAIILDDSGQALLAPGPHDLRLQNRDLGISDVRHITIEPGATTTIEFSRP